MIETALVFDRKGHAIYWHEPPGRSSGYIPDSRDLWDVLWDNRHCLSGVAHTHPWSYAAHPSVIDISTFRAVERGLNKRLLWPVVTLIDCAVFSQDATGGYAVHMPIFSGRKEWKELMQELLRRSTTDGGQQ